MKLMLILITPWRIKFWKKEISWDVVVPIMHIKVHKPYHGIYDNGNPMR